MTNSDSEAKYIGYNNYNYVKGQFERCEKFDHRTVEFDQIIKDINLKQNERKIPITVFIELHKILTNTHIFYGHNTDNYCIYVNHWLNKEFRNSYDDQNKSKFNIFHTFAYNFNGKNYDHNKDYACLEYIKYLNDDVYNRMKILNDLYDKYNQIKPHKVSADDNFCGILNLLGKNYKNAIDEHKDDKNFFKTLKELKRSIEENKWAFNEKCPMTYYLKLPEQNSPQPLEVPQATKQTRDLLQGSLSHGLLRGQDTVQLEGAQRSQATQELQKPSEIAEESESNEVLGSRNAHATRDTSESQYSLGLRIQELQENRDNYELLGIQQPEPITSKEQTYTPSRYGNTYTGVVFGTAGDRFTEVDPNIHTAQKDGFLGKVQGALSSIVEQVDPAPVLGVSGGMGVLFVLFKYTPVGSFFGGRRGRIRQIPRSFGGFAPGEFPNFQEYGVGHVGYSPMDIPHLAE